MQRIDRVNEQTINSSISELLSKVKKQMGVVPNIMATLANSEAALEAYLNLSTSINKTQLSGQQKEQIALAVAGHNQCDYCASAHTYIGASMGLSSQELAANLQGDSANDSTRLMLNFVNELLSHKGNVSDHQLALMHTAGFSDADVLDILAVTVMNIFTNYLNHLAQTEIDFPIVTVQQ